MSHDALRQVGVRLADILLPIPDVALDTWAVVACDQYTAQPEYWAETDAIVGDAPSTLRLIYPEVYLAESADAGRARIATINETMASYLDAGLFDTYGNGLILLRRETESGAVRWGVMVALDLEHYSWEADARTLIRATEGTILDRIPPRQRIRENAPLELPHIMVLISDPQGTVIEPLADTTDSHPVAYDTQLMQGGGRITGWHVTDDESIGSFASALTALSDTLDPDNPLLFAMGDGNHSFATAKSCWEAIKPSVPEAERADHPARYALVEIENIFDEGLEFEPIHRVLFDTPRDAFEAELARHCGSFSIERLDDVEEVMAAVETATVQAFGYCDSDGYAVYVVDEPEAHIAAGTLQRVIDVLVGRGYEVDYIHGVDVTDDLGRRPGNLGLFLAGIAKDTFFETMVSDGALPRKTFSMGEAADKRYYLEARAIR